MKLIDYSQVYYSVLNKQPVPARRKGKFVYLINIASVEEFLILSPIELSKYHATIVERFCQLNAIEGRYTTAKRDYFEIHDSDWTIMGGGYWEIDDTVKTIVLNGCSQAYGSCDLKDLRAKILIANCVKCESISRTEDWKSEDEDKLR